ncbi:helix-turn-helix domain-containing protein [Hymenobacter pini]|uniref:helix-turn-helix domain-containing protein n=1 Tax=Hymenobacter pini TaxID=2880879 RepID=UPI001CF39A26|nr:helix-turn-helix domain-containing protein [Hymenobacter pini]MCA8830562.1 helix-turn-helix domain-containing protein [Hymenobacter pini]
MQATDLATAGFISEHFQAMLAQLQAMQQALPAVAGLPQLLSKEQVAEHCHVSLDTVQRWLHKGKRGRDGSTITLQAYYFSSNQPSIPWAALAAYGQGLDFDLDTLNLGAKASPLAAVSATPIMRKVG